MAAGMRGGLGLVSWVFLGGALVMMFFVILSGVVNVSPLNQIYFLRSNTQGITGAKAISQWTYFYICGDGNMNCDAAHPALPFGYAWAAGSNAPAELIGSNGDNTTSTYYFFMWRFGWVFYIIALFFGVLALFTGLLSCTRLGSGFSSIMCFVASFFQTLAAILMTITFVKARDVLNANNYASQIGTYAFGFTWAAAVALFIATVLFFGGCFVGRNKGDGVTSTKTGFFRRNRSTRSRGSFIDNESQRRVVKEEY